MTKPLIVITGGSSGIGAALVRYIADRGHDVLAIGRDEIRLRGVQRHNPDFIDILCADIGEQTGRKKIVEYLGQNEYQVSHLAHCATALLPIAPISDIKEEDWQRHFATNVAAPLFLTQALYKQNSYQADARVLFIGSYFWDSAKARPKLAAYATSKAALKMLIHVLKLESETMGIQVGMALPGTVKTPLYDTFWQQLGTSSRGNSARPNEPAVVARFLGRILLDANEEDFATREWDYRDEKLKTMIDRLAPEPQARDSVSHFTYSKL